MAKQGKEKGFSVLTFCPISQHKIHCAQIEETAAATLPEEKRHEFCLTKCPVYRINNREKI